MLYYYCLVLHHEPWTEPASSVGKIRLDPCIRVRVYPNVRVRLELFAHDLSKKTISQVKKISPGKWLSIILLFSQQTNPPYSLSRSRNFHINQRK